MTKAFSVTGMIESCPFTEAKRSPVRHPVVTDGISVKSSARSALSVCMDEDGCLFAAGLVICGCD